MNMTNTDIEEDFDVVIKVLETHKAKLLAMDSGDVLCGIGIMQQIRAEQCAELSQAIKLWKEYKSANTIHR